MLEGGLDVPGGLQWLAVAVYPCCRSIHSCLTGLAILGHCVHWLSCQPEVLREIWALSFLSGCLGSEPASVTSSISALLVLLDAADRPFTSIWAAATPAQDSQRRPGLEEKQMQTTQRGRIPERPFLTLGGGDGFSTKGLTSHLLASLPFPTPHRCPQPPAFGKRPPPPRECRPATDGDRHCLGKPGMGFHGAWMGGLCKKSLGPLGDPHLPCRSAVRVPGFICSHLEAPF